jgi:hypothetical protein
MSAGMSVVRWIGRDVDKWAVGLSDAAARLTMEELHCSEALPPQGRPCTAASVFPPGTGSYKAGRRSAGILRA